MVVAVEIDVKQVERLAAQGMTYQQIADSLGIGVSTLYAKKASDTEILEAIKRGKAKGIATITNALFTGAREGNTASQIFFLKNQAGWRDKPPEEEEKDPDDDKVYKVELTVKDETEKK